MFQGPAPYAQVMLAFCHQMGIGVDRDEKKAVELYTLAATAGDVEAQARLGDCYEVCCVRDGT